MIRCQERHHLRFCPEVESSGQYGGGAGLGSGVYSDVFGVGSIWGDQVDLGFNSGIEEQL